MGRRSHQPEVVSERIVIEKLIPGGQALGTRADGKKIFLWNALPGEAICEFILTKDKSSYSEGIATHFETQSPRRIEPRDNCYLSTSPWQIMEYNYELEQKSLLLAEIYRQHDLLEQNREKINLNFKTDSQDYFYRNKMEYALYYDQADEQIHLAFHARGSHQKIVVEQSSIERPEIFQEAQRIVADLNDRHKPAWRYQSLLLRCDRNGKVAGGLYEKHQPHPKFGQLSDNIRGRSYSYSPNGFFQINLPVYEMALHEIAQVVKNYNVLDLYAGVGTIGLSVASTWNGEDSNSEQYGHNLTLVESDKSAYSELENNCAHTSAKAVYAKSEEALDYIQPDQTVILDPPRAGCDPQLIARLCTVEPEQIIYLSCNPATQARDAKQLLEKYQIVSTQGYNFFPRTPHLENLIIMERK